MADIQLDSEMSTAADVTPACLLRFVQESMKFPDELRTASEVIETMEGTSK